MTLQFRAPANSCLDPRSGAASCHRGCAMEDIYVALTGWHPLDAAIDEDGEFDAHVFASIIAVAAAQGSAVHAYVGLSTSEVRRLVEQRFPGASDLWCGCAAEHPHEFEDEAAMLRELLRAHRSTTGEESLWLAAMIARRALEPNHLWEDLGLRNRAELSRLLARHFAPLAARNTRNMRWKRFFYRVLCESDGIVMCATPVCSDCADFDLCFGEETGESALARARRHDAARGRL